jgi:hypothetical protein
MAALAPEARLRSLRIGKCASWLVLIVVGFTLSGCFTDVGTTDTVWVRNNTNVTLHFTIVKVDGKPFDLPEMVAPGETFGLLDGFQLDSDAGLGIERCTAGDLIAYDQSGREIGRHPPPLCARAQDVWTIGPLGSPQPSG